jgi:hypothetical protein
MLSALEGVVLAFWDGDLTGVGEAAVRVAKASGRGTMRPTSSQSRLEGLLGGRGQPHRTLESNPKSKESI